MNYDMFQNAAQYASMAVLAAIGLAVGIAVAAVYLLPVVGWMKRHRVDALLVAPFVVGIILYGGSKGGRINYPRTDPEVWYLMDNGSTVSNDCVVLNFSRNIIVPATAWLYLYALDSVYTNDADWAEFSFCVYSNRFQNMVLPQAVPFPAATNFNFVAFTDWTPPPVTHTNGVAYVAWQIGVGKPTNDLAMVRTGVYIAGVRLAPNPAITNGPPLSAGDRALLSSQLEVPENE